MMTPNTCPSCGNAYEHGPGIVLVGPVDARGPNGDPCDDHFHDEPARQPDQRLAELRRRAVLGSVTAIDAILNELAAREQQLQKCGDDARAVVKDALLLKEQTERQLTSLREAARQAMNELGVPGEGYPAPVANAYELLREALAAADKEP